MEPGPLPPHERTWRHPSEVAAEERVLLTAESAAPSTRVLALTTGTFGLLAVAVLVLTVTPHRNEAPIAIGVTTSPVASVAPAVASTPSDVRGIASGVAALSRPLALTGPAVDAIATPIESGRYAIVTLASARSAGDDELLVKLPSGRVATGTVVAVVGGAAVVELGEPEPGHRIARRRPAADAVVTVMSNPPVSIAYGEVDTLSVLEGTAVLDAEGALVGVCGHDRRTGRVVLIDVTAPLADATNADR